MDIEVDVYEELMNYSWNKGKKKGNEYICCSPFRDEQHPSFSINLETGLWIDFGSDDEYWKKGSFIKLIAFLENISFEESEEMLLEAYGVFLDDVDGLELNINIQNEEVQPKTFTRDDLKEYLIRTIESKSYMNSRGISEEVMKKFIVGYDKKQKAMAFLWLDAKTGKPVTVKFRKIRSKVFYYIDEGQKVNNHIFGLYQVMKEGHKVVFIVESEIDALYLWTLGIPAVALGGSNLSDKQKRLLLLSGIETLVIATDNDKAGFKIRKQLERELMGYMDIKILYLPYHAKDVNDLGPEELLSYAQHLDQPELKIM